MKKTLINEFTYGRSFDLDNGIGTLYDDDEGDIIDIVINDDQDTWSASLYLNEEKYSRDEIVNAEICHLLKKQLLIEFDSIQEQLDNENENLL